MASNYQITYPVDIVLCIDCTGSMRHIIDIVKNNALRLHGDLKAAMEKKSKPLGRTRVRVVAFRDYLAYMKDNLPPMLATPFYDLPAEADKFAAAVRGLEAIGGGELSEESLHRSICEELRAYKTGAGTPGGAVIKGSMTREFPTTVSVAVCRPAADGVTADFYWAGDSRGYILHETGLKQITRDDVNDADDILAQMDSDGVMNNLASLSKAWTLHRTRREHIPAGIAFTATDGCFGYVRTPMEFEYQRLETMCAAECVDDWQNRLEDTLRECAGDDFTLLGVIFGYGEFSAMQRRFRPRLEWLRKTYIEPLETAAPAEINAMWLNYSQSYYA